MTDSSDYPDFRFIKLVSGVLDMAKVMEYIRSHNINILKEAAVAQSLEVMAMFLGCNTPDKGLDRPSWEAAVAVPLWKT